MYHWGASPQHLSQIPPGSLQAPTACCDDGQFLLASALSNHQDSECHLSTKSNRALISLSTYPHTSYYLDHDDVALKNFATCFLHQSYRRGNMLGSDCRNQEGGQIFHQHIKKPVWDHQESELNAMECTLHLKKFESVSTETVSTAQTGHWQKQTLLVWFHWDICPEGVDEIY